MNRHAVPIKDGVIPILELQEVWERPEYGLTTVSAILSKI